MQLFVSAHASILMQVLGGHATIHVCIMISKFLELAYVLHIIKVRDKLFFFSMALNQDKGIQGSVAHSSPTKVL